MLFTAVMKGPYLTRYCTSIKLQDYTHIGFMPLHTKQSEQVSDRQTVITDRQTDTDHYNRQIDCQTNRQRHCYNRQTANQHKHVTAQGFGAGLIYFITNWLDQNISEFCLSPANMLNHTLTSNTSNMGSLIATRFMTSGDSILTSHTHTIYCTISQQVQYRSV